MKDNFRQAFIEEAAELLDELEYSLLELEKGANDSNLIAKVFRALHTVKGSAGMFGYDDISLFIHDIETVYEHIRKGEIIITQDIIGKTLAAKDRIWEMLNNPNTKAYSNNQNTKNIQIGFRNIILDYNCKNNINVQKSENKSSEHVKSDNIGNNYFTYHIRFQPFKNIFLNGTNPVYLLNELRKLGPSIVVGNVELIPGFEHLTPSSCFTYWNIILTTGEGIDVIKKIFGFVDDVLCSLNIKRIDNRGELNSRLAHVKLEQLLITKQYISNEDRDNIIQRTSKNNHYIHNKNFSDFEKIEKLKENFRNSGFNSLVDNLKSIISDINEFVLKLEADSKNQDYLDNISAALWIIIDISNYFSLKNLSETAGYLKKLIMSSVDSSKDIDSETIEVLIQGIDYLNEILENVLTNSPVEDNEELIILIKELVIKYGIQVNRTHSELDIITANEDEENNTSVIFTGNVSSVNSKIKAFFNQIEQYRDMIIMSTDTYPLTDIKLQILIRLLNNLENAAKYMSHMELLQKVRTSKQTVLDEQQVNTQNNLGSLIKYLTGMINGKIPIEFAEPLLIKTIETASGNEIQQDKANKIINAEEAIFLDEKPKSNVELENRTMRVDEYKIDSFSNMIGELIIARNSYEYLLNEVYSKNKIEQTIEKKLNDNLHLLSRLTNDLQVGVMTLRMVPLKNIFQKYSRVIRDISKKQNKKIDFITQGNDTEVDKKIADSLSDPLIHLIRNSCDHGIELPEERIKLGKPETGTIVLNASIQGGKLIIVIKDDGKGLDRKKILEKAQKMGINIELYDNNTIFDLIFEPGFSTKTEVSELSGRGVGMDVVKTTLDKLDGNINVKTEENIGTEITFVIPMSIGLSESLLIESNGETYALPIQYVLKTLKLEPSHFYRMHDRLGFNHRGEVIPTASFSELLNGKSDEVTEQLFFFKEKLFNNDLEEISVVIIQTKLGCFGVIVDKLLKNIELSIKPVPGCMANSNVISGVSILGNGNVVLVINPEKFF